MASQNKTRQPQALVFAKNPLVSNELKMQGRKEESKEGRQALDILILESEALEEATSELFGSMIYKALVDPTANIASIEDILYAAIIGGLTGAVMFGGDVVFGTKRLSVLDGKLVETKTLTPEQRKTATKLDLGKSYTLQNALAKAQTLSEKTTNVTKLMTKYGTSLQDIQQNHAEEFNNMGK